MSELLHSLAYFSRNAITGNPAEVRTEIDAILASARRNNQRNAVTGALLFSDGCFAQVLEGPREAVEAIFETIQCDPRHREVTILHLHEVDQRSFGEWSMAFAGLDGISVDPKIDADGMRAHDDILTTAAGQNLLAALRSVVQRDDMARRDEAVPG
jgi:hypothetical protein